MPPLPEAMPDGRPWPKFSIVTPSYNFEKFLEMTIRSVLLQGYPDLEYIVIDGGSTDGSVAIVRKYEKWLSHWASERDSGPEEASNKGFRKATGELMAWLGSDDIYLPGALGVAAQEMSRQPDCCVINGDARARDGCGRVLEVIRAGEVTRDRLVRFWTKPPYYALPATVAVFFRRRVVEEVGLMNEKLRVVSDYEWWLRMIQKFPFHYVPHLFSEFCLHPAAKSAAFKTNAFENTLDAELTAVSRLYWGAPTKWRFWWMWTECHVYWVRVWFHRSKSAWLTSSYSAYAAGRRVCCLAWLLAVFIRSPVYSIRGGGIGLALRALAGEARERRLKRWLRWKR
ncbi:MAG: glycosyltransferase family 2 protein [Verrucomicrobiia bacterium]